MVEGALPHRLAPSLISLLIRSIYTCEVIYLYFFLSELILLSASINCVTSHNALIPAKINTIIIASKVANT